jgi:hypothetical protein
LPTLERINKSSAETAAASSLLQVARVRQRLGLVAQ